MNRMTFETRVSADHLVHLPDELPVGAFVRIKVEEIADDTAADDYQARTDIGRLALAARQAYLNGGGKLLNADEIQDEVRRRRGGLQE